MLIKGSFYAFYDNYHKYDNAALIDEICAFLGQCTREGALTQSDQQEEILPPVAFLF